VAVVDRIGWAWALACAAGFLLLCRLTWSFVTDDAWITVRYAENLASGDGFAWNPGGERVEGFSNPLLVIVEALAHLAGIPAIATARAVGIASGLGLVVLLWRLGPPVVGTTAARVGLLLTALYPPIALWAVGGLETVPAALALTAGVLWLIADRPRAALLGGAALAVLPWLRPEGLAVALAVAILAEAPGLRRRAQRRTAGRRLALAAGLPLASQGLLEIARLAVYGHLLPNSALYKSGRGMTTEVLERFLMQAGPLLLLAACGLLAARRRQRLLIVPALVYAAGSVGMLNSVNSFSRLLLPAWPALALLAGVAIAAGYGRLRRTRAAAAIAAAALFVVSTVAMASLVARFGEAYAACGQDARLEAAAWLRTNTPPGTVYSVSDAGLLPLRAGDRTAVDQLRLNEAQLQRTGRLPLPREIALVYEARPEVLVLASTRPDRFSGRYVADRTMTADPRFAAYALAHVARGDGPGCRYHLFLYRRR
jgi:arabinofuranosyltransferase